MRTFLLLLTSAPLSCAFEAETEPLVGVSEHAVLTTLTLDNDVSLTCNDSFVNAPGLEFTLRLDTDDTVWMAGDSEVSYPAPRPPYCCSGDHTIEEPLTYLSCRPGTTPDANGLPPDGAHIAGFTAQNLWDAEGLAVNNLVDTHKTRAIFTAPGPGDYTCWMTYGCKNPSGEVGTVRFEGTSTLRYYTPNQYPGQSWNQPADHNCDGNHDTDADGCEVVNDPPGPTGEPVAHMPHLQTWLAEQLTAGDSEVVVMWSPTITTCNASDDDGIGIDRCDAPDMMTGNEDTSFRWRLGVYQRNGGATCNKAFGAWSAPVLCPWRTHHCGADIYSDAFPIITDPQTGSEGIPCGTSTATRNFKVFAQIRKADGEDNDLVVESGGGGTQSNLVIYSR